MRMALTRAKLTGVWARSLERAFPALYPYVDPLVKREQVEWARAEIEREKAEKAEKRAAKKAGPKMRKTDVQKAEQESQPTNAKADAPRRRRKQENQ